MRDLVRAAALVYCYCLMLPACRQPGGDSASWPVYRGDKGSTGYSSLLQINRSNVSSLTPVWTFHTGDARPGNRGTIQCDPIIVQGIMYVTSPMLKLMALDAATGREIWRFDPFAGGEASGVNRGVTYWDDGEKEKRIFFSAGAFVYALDALNGKPLDAFGDHGKIDLRAGLGREASRLAVWSTSPGVVYRDLLIQGCTVDEGYDAAPGFVRAYDARTGRTVWTFHTIPQPGEFGYDTWDKDSYRHVGGTNAWAGMSLDEGRGIVFIPLGSPAFDFYGANRKGENLFGNSLVALDAATGRRIWHFQLVHHDLWDYDLPAPPTLVTLRNDTIKYAVAQVTKMGMLFLFDRTTGRPVFPIEERKTGVSRLPGEEAWPTQPFPKKPAPFVRQHFSEKDITDISDSAYSFVRHRIGTARMGDIYTPPDTGGTVQLPGTRGGAEWGGASFDPETGLLYVNANELPLLLKMARLPDEDNQPATDGGRVFAVNGCAMCHGAQREGIGSFPSLKHLADRMNRDQVEALLRTGRGQMPSFPGLSKEDRKALVGWLLGDRTISKATDRALSAHGPGRYVNNGWTQLMDQDGHPGIKPPWGTLNAIDLNKGELLWRVPLGEYEDLKKRGVPPTGTQNLGGCIVTAGGLVVIGAASDERLRVFDKLTGKLLWQYKLPAGGYATPSTYMVNGRQYIVIAAGGGGKVGTPSGDSYIAFALPEGQ